MSDHTSIELNQQDLFGDENAKGLLDQLLTDSRLYTKSKDYKELLDFTIRLRNFAPFNAMLLQVQKPGLRYAASAKDWITIFGRTIKEDARPLLILWPFGPVALVYDLMDTEGQELPKNVAAFFATGTIHAQQFREFEHLLHKKNILWQWIDAGDSKAGSIRVLSRAKTNDEHNQYKMKINRNHPLPTQFATLAHELGHLFLGHLGRDKKLSIPLRPRLTHEQQELEAESVAYLVCKRNGITSKSETYLSNYVKEHTTVDNIDFYQVMRAAGQVETILKLGSHTKYR